MTQNWRLHELQYVVRLNWIDLWRVIELRRTKRKVLTRTYLHIFSGLNAPFHHTYSESKTKWEQQNWAQPDQYHSTGSGIYTMTIKLLCTWLDELKKTLFSPLTRLQWSFIRTIYTLLYFITKQILRGSNGRQMVRNTTSTFSIWYLAFMTPMSLSVE